MTALTHDMVRHTRRTPCAVCGGGDDLPRGKGVRCSGFTSDGGAWVRCTRMGDADGAELDDGCSPPAYKWRRREDGTYRPWTPTPPARTGRDPIPLHPRTASTLKIDTKTHERHEGVRYFDYGPTQRVRREDRSDGTKTIRPEYRAGGQWHTGDGSEPIECVYRRDALTARPDALVLLVEGEGVADTLNAAGFLAVTWRGGANRTAKAIPQLVDALAGRDVVPLPDADAPGREAMQHIGDALAPVAASVRLLDLYPGSGGGLDAEDFLHDHDADADALTARIASAPDFAPTGSDGADAGSTPPATGVWTPKITYLSDVQPERVAWLWLLRLALGKLGVIDGDPGDGKSTLTTDLAARVSTGREMPDGTPGLGYPAGVVLLSAEDGLADTIRPRLDAAGGDPARVVALECATDGDRERGVTLTDLPMIEQAIAAVDARLVIVDPLMAYLGSDTNSYRDQDVRGILAPLARLAEKTGVAIVVVRHFSKAVGGKVLHKGGGSVGIVGAVRTALMVARDPDDPEGPRRILAQQKSNIGVFGASLAFHMEEHENGAARIVWEGATAHTAAELVAAPPDGEERSALDEACDVLQKILANGRIDAKTVQQEARAAGISEATLRRAKKTLNVVTTRNGFGPQAVWFWELPPKGENHRCSPSSIDAHPREHEHLWEDVSIYDSHQTEALPSDGGNDDITIDAQPQYKEATPEDLAWAEAHIQSGALSLVAADMARIRRLCGGILNPQTWRADVCERYGWPTPPPLALPPPPTPAPPDVPDTTALVGWLAAVRDDGLDILPRGIRAVATLCGIPPGADEPPDAFAARLAAWLHERREVA